MRYFMICDGEIANNTPFSKRKNDQNIREITKINTNKELNR